MTALPKLQEHPLVEPQVLHFMQVPLRTNVKLLLVLLLLSSLSFLCVLAMRLAWASLAACLEESAASSEATCAPTGLPAGAICASRLVRISVRSTMPSS